MKPILLAAVVLAAPLSASAQQKADFIDGTYTMSSEACQKLRALAKGTKPSVSTEPWHVDRNGFHAWEGGCGFTRIVERQKGKSWDVTARCTEGPETSTERYTFVRAGEGAFDVRLKGEKKPRRYTRCDVEKGK